MNHQESHNSAATAALTQRVWETLTAAQRETVLQTMVRICRQIADQWTQEERHEPVADR